MFEIFELYLITDETKGSKIGFELRYELIFELKLLRWLLPLSLSSKLAIKENTINFETRNSNSKQKAKLSNMQSEIKLYH